MTLGLRNPGAEGERSRFDIKTALGFAASDDPADLEAQFARVERAANLWPVAIASQCIAIAVIIGAVVSQGGLSGVAGIAALGFGSFGAGLMLLLILKLRRHWQKKPERMMRYALAATMAQGALAVMLGRQTAHVAEADGAVLGLAALIAAGVVSIAALFPLPAVLLGLSFAVVLSTSLVINNSVVTVIGLGLFACLWLMSKNSMRLEYRDTRRRMRLERDSRRAVRLITEFEANGNGWFWETDRGGNLVYVSERFAHALGRQPQELMGRSLTSLIVSQESEKDYERTLGFHISTRTPFSDIAVRAAPGDSGDEETESWWSLSGRPIIDSIGQYRGFSGSGFDLTEKRRSEAEVKRLAKYDELTGLSNRQQMRDILKRATSPDTHGRERPASLLLLDLDRFKSVNDTMGHPVGDTLLQQVGQRLSRAVDDEGMVGRLGGDEFQVVLPGTDHRPKLEELARSIISTLSQPYMIDGTPVTIGCSVGIAISPYDGDTPEALIRNADLALYAAKADGRGRHRFYKPEMHAGAKKRKRLEDDLRHALAKGDLHLTYQPQVSTRTERIVGYEALIRWTHSELGPISPAEFIPIAEDIRLIEQLGEWVIRTACEEAAAWPAKVRVAVNVSPIQFANPSLPATVTHALSRTGLSPERLELEITESVFLEEGTNSSQMFERLKKLGVRLALDDFGTGYSSLGYLKTTPFDKIKIDQSFIRGAAVPGNRNAAIVKAIVTLADTLKMETTAEGVEMEDEIELVRKLGCSHIQGYIYGKPMLAEEVRKQLGVGQAKAVPSGYKASRSPRFKVLRASTVEVGGHKRQVIIRNVSATGAMIEGLGAVKPGTEIDIEILENEKMKAVVRWNRKEHCGIEFERNIEIHQKQVQRPPLRKSA